MEIDLYEGVRAILITITGVVLVAFTYLYIKGFSRMSRAQKLFTGAVLNFIAAVGIRSIEAVNDGDPFKWALVPYITGLVLSIAYLALPKHEKTERLGEDDVYSHEDIQAVRDQLHESLIRNEELRDQLYRKSHRLNDAMVEVYRLREGATE